MAETRGQILAQFLTHSCSSCCSRSGYGGPDGGDSGPNPGPVSDPLLEQQLEQDKEGWEQLMQGMADFTTMDPTQFGFPSDETPQQFLLNGAEGSSVDLPCKLPAGPDLKWERQDGEPLPSEAKQVRSALRIPRVTIQDSGRYSCSSRGRTQFVDLRLEKVTTNPMEPQISVSASFTLPRLDQPLDITCNVVGVGGRGLQVTWSKVGGGMADNVEVKGR